MKMSNFERKYCPGYCHVICTGKTKSTSEKSVLNSNKAHIYMAEMRGYIFRGHYRCCQHCTEESKKEIKKHSRARRKEIGCL